MKIFIGCIFIILYLFCSCIKDFKHHHTAYRPANIIKIRVLEFNANQYLFNNDVSLAIPLFKHLIEIIGIGDNQLLAQTHIKLGSCFFSINELKESIINLRCGLDFYSRVPSNGLTDSDYNYIYSCTILLSNCYRINGEHKMALHYLDKVEKSITQNCTFNNTRYLTELLSEVYTWKALVCFDSGEFENSITYNYKAINIIKEHDLPMCLIHNNLSQLGRIFMYEEDYIKSEQYYQRAANIIIDCYGDSSSQYIEQLSDLGLLYIESKIFEKALSCFSTIHCILNKQVTKGDIQYAFSYNDLADTYCGLGQFSIAIDYYNRALELFTKHHHLDEACVVYHNLGIANYSIGRYCAAEEFYLQSLKMSEQIRQKNNIYTSYTHRRLGQLYLRKQQYVFAISHFSNAIKELSRFDSDSTHEINPFLNRKILCKSDLIKSLYFKGLCELYEYYQKNDSRMLIGSINSFQKALALSDFLRNHHNYEKTMLSLNKMIIPLIENYLYSLLQLKIINPGITNDNNILETIDRTKYTALRSLINATKFTKDSYLPAHIKISIDSLYKSMRCFENYNSGYQQNIQEESSVYKADNLLFETTYTLDTLLCSLKQRYPKFNTSLYHFSFYKINEVQALLPDSTGIIEYYHNDSIIVILAINKKQYKIFHTICDTGMTQMKNSLRRSIIFSCQKEFNVASEYFYEELIEPIYCIIEDVKNVIIIPDMYFSGFPFEVLTKPNVQPRGIKEDIPDYLVKHFDISYYFSLSLWGDYQKSLDEIKQETWESEFSGFAPLSEIPKSRFGLFLPYSKHEIEAISKIFEASGKSVKTYLNKSSTEKTIYRALGNSRIVHIASHSNSTNDSENYSIMLQENEDEPYFEKSFQNLDDGQISLYEIYNLDIKSDLVTLSMCSSGYGDQNAGEGISSLSHGLYYSGARNILYTLWDVSDNHSTIFMNKFYQYLNSGYSYSRALRKTKLEFINSDINLPVFWSGYLLNG